MGLDYAAPEDAEVGKIGNRKTKMRRWRTEVEKVGAACSCIPKFFKQGRRKKEEYQAHNIER